MKYLFTINCFHEIFSMRCSQQKIQIVNLKMPPILSQSSALLCLLHVLGKEEDKSLSILEALLHLSKYASSICKVPCYSSRFLPILVPVEYYNIFSQIYNAGLKFASSVSTPICVICICKKGGSMIINNS